MVERGGLENRCAFTGTEGSNPSLSAIRQNATLLLVAFRNGEFSPEVVV